eukprot:scaffold1299_cov331-Prasinococcus_capsulatus_cf.AAC.4
MGPKTSLASPWSHADCVGVGSGSCTGQIVVDMESGSVFEYKLLWALLLSNGMGLLFQHLCSRLALVSGRNLAEENSAEYSQRSVRVFLWLTVELASIAADLGYVAPHVSPLVSPSIDATLTSRAVPSSQVCDGHGHGAHDPFRHQAALGRVDHGPRYLPGAGAAADRYPQRGDGGRRALRRRHHLLHRRAAHGAPRAGCLFARAMSAPATKRGARLTLVVLALLRRRRTGEAERRRRAGRPHAAAVAQQREVLVRHIPGAHSGGAGRATKGCGRRTPVQQAMQLCL